MTSVRNEALASCARLGVWPPLVARQPAQTGSIPQTIGALLAQEGRG